MRLDYKCVELTGIQRSCAKMRWRGIYATDRAGVGAGVLKMVVSFVTEAKPKERTVLSVSITDTDAFEHVLAILGVIYRNTKDGGLKKYIEEELERALKGEWDIEGVLNPRR